MSSKKSQIVLFSLVVILILLLVFPVAVYLNIAFLRTCLGLLFVSLIPGYVVMTVLLPFEERDFSILEITVFSISGSIVISSFVSFLLAITPLGFSLNNIFISLFSFTLLLTVLGISKRRHHINKLLQVLSPHSMANPDPGIPKLINLILYFSIILALTVGAIAILVPQRQEHFTEFFITQTEENKFILDFAQDDHSVNIPITIINHEGKDVEYILQTVAVNNYRQVIVHTETIIVKAGSLFSTIIRLDNLPSSMDVIELDLFFPGVVEPYRSLKLEIPKT